MTTPEQHQQHQQHRQPTAAPETAPPPENAPPLETVTPPGPPPEQSGGEMRGGQMQGGAPMQSPPQAAQAHHADTARTDDESLFGDLLSGLRSRWDEVQAGFVDDPQQCVQQADRLVTDVVDRVTARFEEARNRLEAQWARGEQASTEDLRLALKRYRDFFQRLLSMDDNGTHGTHSTPASQQQQPVRTDTHTA